VQFCDKAVIHISSGRGGHGCASFRREIFAPKGGPNGGNGGKGGDVKIVSDSSISSLLFYKYKRHFVADNGHSGRKNRSTGKSGSDLILKVPVGTQVYEAQSLALIYDFTQDQEELVLLPGGKGGAGNTCFKSSTNQSPRTSIPGEEGKEMTLNLELKLIADIGLVGLPNAGKSTFLNILTPAKSLVAAYPFSTLVPQLGTIYYEDIKHTLADTPGLIEDASKGKGLGHRFLQHIERCKTIVHLIDCTSLHLVEDYNIIRNELQEYSSKMLAKPIITCLTKCDLLDDSTLNQKRQVLEAHIGKKPHLVSRENPDAIKNAVIEAIRELSCV
jgi:GTP-binding protein